MEYNPMYRPQNPQESKQHSDVDIIHTGHMMQSHTHTHTHTHTPTVICDGHRQMLTLQTNKAYGDPKMETQTAEKLTDAEHIYESI